MVSKKELNNNLNDFFSEEYQSLKIFVRSKIDYTTDSDAEDIIQDVALKIFSRPIDALPINNVAGFVYGAIKNRIIDIMRVRKERIYDEKKVEDLWTAFADQFYGTSDNSYSEDLKEQVKTAVLDLKPAYRDIILAVDFEGYTYREICEETGISQGTLMSRRHRAISLLLKNLEKKKRTI